MVRRRHIGFVMLLLGWAMTAQAQVKVTATVDENPIGDEEVLTYTITVEGASFANIRTPQPPEAQGLALLRRIPSTNQSISMINGRTTQSLGFSWQFKPNARGNAQIATTEVSIGDQTFRTTAITVRVVPQSQRPQRPSSSDPFDRLFGSTRPNQPPPEPEPISDNDLFIRTVPSVRSVVPNQQVTIDYVLYFRNGIRLRNSRLADSWDAEGFWREDLEIEQRPVPRTEVINGLQYNVITLKRAAVFPTRAGRLRVDPLKIQSEVYQPQSSQDRFRQFFSTFSAQFQDMTLTSPSVSIQVAPLPDPQPDTFTGAVGQFTLQTRLDRADVAAGEPVKLTATLRGSGNLATLPEPTFLLPTLIEKYDPEISEQIDRSGRTVRGTKTFTYTLIPRSGGAHIIPALSFSYFDPAAKGYKTLTSEPHPITVRGEALDPAANVVRNAAGFPVNDIADPLVADVTWQPVNQRALHQNPMLFWGLVVPIFGLFGLYAVRLRREKLTTDVQYARSRRAHPVARKHLKQAEKLLRADEPEAFYEEIARALMGFIGNRLNVAELGLTHAQLDLQLAELDVAPALRTDLRVLLEECDQARYAPVRPSHATMETATERAATLIAELDDRFKQVL